MSHDLKKRLWVKVARFMSFKDVSLHEMHPINPVARRLSTCQFAHTQVDR